MKKSLFTKATLGKHEERAEAFLRIHPSEASQRISKLAVKFTVLFSVAGFYAGLRLVLNLKEKNISKGNSYPNFHTRGQRWPEGDNLVLRVFLI